MGGRSFGSIVTLLLQFKHVFKGLIVLNKQFHLFKYKKGKKDFFWAPENVFNTKVPPFWLAIASLTDPIATFFLPFQIAQNQE